MTPPHHWAGCGVQASGAQTSTLHWPGHGTAHLILLLIEPEPLSSYLLSLPLPCPPDPEGSQPFPKDLPNISGHPQGTYQSWLPQSTCPSCLSSTHLIPLAEAHHWPYWQCWQWEHQGLCPGWSSPVVCTSKVWKLVWWMTWVRSGSWRKCGQMSE